MKNRYFAGQFWIWSLRAPLMRLVPKVDFFQVLLDGVDSNLPNLPWKLGYKKNELSPSFFHVNFPRSSILMFSNFPRSSQWKYINDECGKWLLRTSSNPSLLPTLIILRSFIWKMMSGGSKIHTKWWAWEVLFISHPSTVQWKKILIHLWEVFLGSSLQFKKTRSKTFALPYWNQIQIE